MQSNDFIEGVSGWRLAPGKLEIYGGADPVIIGNLDASEAGDVQSKPFIVVDGVTYINAGFIKEAYVESQLAANWSVRVHLGADGRPFAAGLGIGELEGFEFNLADQVKEVIRSELRQGGLLWRGL